MTDPTRRTLPERYSSEVKTGQKFTFTVAGKQYKLDWTQPAIERFMPIMKTVAACMTLRDEGLMPEQETQINTLLAKHGVIHADGMTRARKEIGRAHV